MHDGATPHTAHRTQDFLAFFGLNVMPWPAVSPDMNPYENLWGTMAQRVYANGRQFQTVEALQQCGLDTWSSLEVQDLEDLTSSMPKRCIALLQNNGKATKY